MATKSPWIVWAKPLTAEEWRRVGVFLSVPLKKDVLEGTVNDPRLGVVTYDRICGTCQRGFEMCPGHWGYIELVEPCYNPVYGSWVVGVLQCVCLSCFRPRQVEKFTSFAACKEKASQATVCPHPDCAKPLRKFSFNKDKKTIESSLPKKKKMVELPAREVAAIFRSLSDEVVSAIGLNQHVEQLGEYVKGLPTLLRPEAMIYEVFPVCPLNITPPIVHAEGVVDDDIRSGYNRLIKLNNSAIALRDQVQTTRRGSKDYAELVEEVRTLVWVLSSPSPKDKAKSTRGGEIRSFPDRIKGKRGDKNSHVAGKRGDQTARGVVSPGGPKLGFGEVGVPESFARVLTYPEMVTRWNIDWWTAELKRGNVPRVRRNGRLVSVPHSLTPEGEFTYKDELGLRVGDEVHRYLHDGDYPWLGRQPSLRPESLQGLRAKIVPGDTILLPLAHTPAYGADFDGDEMTLYCPANAGRIEAMVLSASAFGIVSVQHGVPIMAPVQNALIYSSVLTNTYSTPRDIEEPNCLTREGKPGYQAMVKRDVWMDCVTHLKVSPARLGSFFVRAREVYPEYFDASGKLLERIPGRLALSITFPANLTWRMASSPFNPSAGEVVIIDGILAAKSGPLCKKSIGRSAGGIVHVLWLQHPQLAARFINEVQYMTGVLGPSVGFSLGWVDCLTRPQSASDVDEALQKAKINAKIILSKNLDAVTTERQLNANFNKVRDVAIKIVNTGMMTGEHNAFTALAGAGSKGSPLNLLQIVGCLGQQNVQGDRIPMTISSDTRVIPHYPKNDPSPEAHGLITDSFLKGLSPGSQWHHCTSSREGVIVTGTETSTSGYIQKQSCKKMGDLVVYHDGSVRNAQGLVFNFLYGGDGLSAKYSIQEKGVLFFTSVSHIVSTADYLLRQRRPVEELSPPRKPTLQEATAMASRLFSAGPKFRESPVVKLATQRLRETTTKILLATEMRPEVMPEVAVEISKALEIARAKNGDAVGLIAGLSCGETTTQMTLNVFQNAGNSEKNVTLGIPRLNELIRSSKKLPKNNQNTSVVYLADPLVSQLTAEILAMPDGEAKKTAEIDLMEHLKVMANSLVALDFRDVVEKTTIYRVGEFDHSRESPVNCPTSYATYQRPEWVPDDVEEEGWVIEFKLKAQEVYDYSLDLEEVAEVIKTELSGGWGNCVRILNSPRWMATLLVVIDFKSIRPYAVGRLDELTVKVPERNRTLLTPERLDFFITRDVVVGMCLKVRIQGIEGITKGYVRREGDEWVIDTQGTNFAQILGLDWVDPTRTVSDKAWEIYTSLGIEATRTFLIKELKKVVCFDGALVATRHFEVIADSMTQSGAMTPVSATGIDRSTGPTTKGMFAKPIDNWTHAAVIGEFDNTLTNDVAIFTGVPPGLGTGRARATFTGGRR